MMRKFLPLAVLVLLLVPLAAFAQDPSPPSDPAMILGGLIAAFKAGMWLKVGGYVAAILLVIGDMLDPLKWIPASLDKVMAALITGAMAFSVMTLSGASVSDMIAGIGAVAFAAFLHPPDAIMLRFGRMPAAPPAA